MNAPTCRWHPEDYDSLSRTGPDCGAPATYLSCQPSRDTPTCFTHRCQCARLISPPHPAVTPCAPAADARPGDPKCERCGGAGELYVDERVSNRTIPCPACTVTVTLPRALVAQLRDPGHEVAAALKLAAAFLRAVKL